MTVVLATACANAQPNSPDGPCQGSEDNTVGCPRVWAETTPAFFPESPADHTYVKFLKENGQWQSFPCFGTCNGGQELPDTKYSTRKDNKEIIQYMADHTPCKWPKRYYLIIGVCHQLANRSLFHTRKTVRNARMCNWTSFVYQTYGADFWPLREYSMNNCRETSAINGTWQEGSPATCLPSGVEKAKPAEPDEEYQIYMKHFGDPKVPKDVQSMDMTNQLKAYRDDLLKLQIKQRLGYN